uniref:HNH endonuclease n=1 Tax=Pithovirus LCPAC403 TaxID=2506596 RepID=A0A481ZAP1_9VIRU|nr:MAG: HNH endonuclease [Pithovirus LCPAC403]
MGFRCGCETKRGGLCAKLVKKERGKCVIHKDSPTIVSFPCEILIDAKALCTKRVRVKGILCKDHRVPKGIVCGFPKTRGKGKCIQPVPNLGDKCVTHKGMIYDEMTDIYMCGQPKSGNRGPCKKVVKSKDGKCKDHDESVKDNFICGEPRVRNKGPCTQSVSIIGGKCRHHNDTNIKCNTTSTNDGKPCRQIVTVLGDKCKKHNGTKKKITFKCGSETKWTKSPCEREVGNLGEKCYDHNPNKKIVKLFPDEEPEKKHDHELCKHCNEPVEWKWMQKMNFSRYQLSHTGRIYNVMREEYLNGSHNIDGYLTYGLTDDDNKWINLSVQSLFRVVYFDISPYDKDAEEVITMDHINQDKKNNCVCNLRPATLSVQANNQTRCINKQGRKVFKLDDNDTIIEEFDSIRQAVDKLENISSDMLRKCCNNGNKFNGYRYKFFDKRDLPKQNWKSTSELYPNIQPPIEISDEGYVYRKSGRLNRGTKHGLYYRIGVYDIKKGKIVQMYVHILVWTVFNNRLATSGLQISHKNSKGRDNRLINLEEVTRSRNIMVTVLNGLHKNAIQVRKHYHDGIYKHYMSIGLAARDTPTASDTLIRNALHGGGLAGWCECGLQYSWERC